MARSNQVAEVIAAYPPAARSRYAEVRELLLGEAERLDVGPLTETLKWGQPSYLTEATRAGTTVRLAWSEKSPDALRVYVHCQTSLVEDWRHSIGDALEFEGNRAIVLPLDVALSREPLAQCLSAALTYHRR